MDPSWVLPTVWSKNSCNNSTFATWVPFNFFPPWRLNTMVLELSSNYPLGGGFISYFHPYLGKWSNLTHFFHMG